jgi:hypothetical protein
MMWVIEKFIGSRLHFYCPGARGRGLEHDWSEKFEFALKLADQESADRVCIYLCGNQGRSAQHAYIAPPNGA